MKVINYWVNEKGLKEIREFLAANHKNEGFTDENISAWATKAEFQLGEGNPASIEIKSWDCIHGRTVEYTISDEGLDAREVEIDD